MKQKIYILLERVEIQGANAVSSPLTYGFPAISGFVGAVHALNRRLPENILLDFEGVAVASHYCAPHIFRSDMFSDAVFVQTRNPILKSGDTRPIVEEGKVNLTVSLMVEAAADAEALHHADGWCETLKELVYTQRFAGGSVAHIRNVRIFSADRCRDMILRICPSYVLQEAPIELEAVVAELRSGVKHQITNYSVFPTNPPVPTGLPAQPNVSALDALLTMSKIYHIPPEKTDENTDKAKKTPKWSIYSAKSGHGWLVPIPVGYQAISEQYAAGAMLHSRRQDYPSQYVESIYTLGKWVFATCLLQDAEADEILENSVWRYLPPQNGIYRISTNPQDLD